METVEPLNEILNDLIRVNHDRAACYSKVIEHLPAADSDLKYLFQQFVIESDDYADQLASYIRVNGGKPSTRATISGKIYRMWMQVRLEVTAADKEMILTSCKFGEDAAQRAYKQALDADIKMPPEIRNTIVRQKLALKCAGSRESVVNSR